MKKAALLACLAVFGNLFSVKAEVVPPAAQANHTERAALQRFLGAGTKVTTLKEPSASHYAGGMMAPDETKITFSGQGSSGVGSPQYMWLGTPDGRWKHIILPFLYRANPAGFSPDSKALLVLGENMDEGTNTTEEATPISLPALIGLWEFSLESRKATRLTPHDFDVIDAAYSPDGKYIAFYAVKMQGVQATEYSKYNRWNNSSVYLMNRDGSHLRRLGPGGGKYGFNLLVWSPDGKHLAVEYDTAIDEKTHTQEASIFRTDGTGSRKLFEVNHASDYPKYTNNVHANGKVLTADPAHPLHIDSLSGFVWRDNKTLLVFGLGVKMDDSYTGEIFKAALNRRSIKILRGYQFPNLGNRQSQSFFVEGNKGIYEVTLHPR